MNRWIEKSVKLANSKGYFDKLLDVYPIEVGINREIPQEVIDEIN